MTASALRTEFVIPIAREVTPLKSSREWVGKDDAETILGKMLAAWITQVSEDEALFKQHVYNNNDLQDSDARQHRARLCHTISVGENLALGFIMLGEQPGQSETTATVSMIDQTIKKLSDTFFAWHGSLSAQSDIPESFKQASLEVEEGKVVDLDI